MSEQVIKDIEISMEQAKAITGFGDALTRLSSNRDFKRIIREGYFKDEAVRLTHLKSDVSMQSPEMQGEVLRGIDGIGSLVSYLRNIEHQAMLAEAAIAEGSEQISELMTEGDE